MRTVAQLAFAAVVLLLPATAAAESPTTTRIETRPFYGATVTLEEGVRVFRPLPPHGRVIINPGGRTPLNLSYEDHRSVSHNYHHGDDAPGAAASASASAVPYGVGRGHRHHGHHGHHPVGRR